MLHFHRQHRSLSSGLSALRDKAATELQQHVPSPKDAIPKNIEPIIGLEVHAQLNTKAKLFSRGCNSSSARPNSQLDLLDISMPGSLPKLNGPALRAAILTGLGLNCTIQDVIHFDRKNYFYSDMPAGFQITQCNKPIATSGHLDFIVSPYRNSLIAHSQQYDITRYLYMDERAQVDKFVPYLKRSHIKQLQLEQDSAKTLHQTVASTSAAVGAPPSIDSAERTLNDLVDYNRSGSGLIEIVFEPDLTSAHEASSLVRELIMLLRALKSCDCELQEGSLRVDANVSIGHLDGQPVPRELANRVELKNLNSLRSLNRGIAHEILRQAGELAAGRQIVQESRTYDTKRGVTTRLRDKESALDYRYVPEPSLPPLTIERLLLDDIRSRLDESKLPHQMRDSLCAQYQLDLVTVMELIDEPGLADYYVEVMTSAAGHEGLASLGANTVADFLIYSVANLKQTVQGKLPLEVNLEDRASDFWQKLSPLKVQEILRMIADDDISFAIGYETMKCLLTSCHADQEPRALVQSLNWMHIKNQLEVDKLCLDLVRGMRSVSRKYARRGDKGALRMMLTKLNELHDNRISVRCAIESLNKHLKPPAVGSSPRAPPDEPKDRPTDA